jgi:hypothetical protein
VRVALACNAAVPPDFPLVAFTLGNRCDSSVPVDFTRLVVTGRMSDGGDGELTLSAFDPAHEIHPAVLGARAMGREVLEYDANPREASRWLAGVCVDVSGLANGGERAFPLCLTRPVDACARR